MKLTFTEQMLLHLLHEAGGSICTSSDRRITKEVRRAANRLADKGLLSIEETQDGPKFSLTAQGKAEVNHG